MSDSKENKLPDATTNQSTEIKESVKEVKKDALEEKEIEQVESEKDMPSTPESKVTATSENEETTSEKDTPAAPQSKVIETSESEGVTSENETPATPQNKVAVKLESEAATTSKSELTTPEKEAIPPEDKAIKEVEGSPKEGLEVDTKAAMTEDESTENEKPVENKPSEAVDKIEEEVAKKSENQNQVAEIPLADYEALELLGVVVTIKSLLEEQPIQAIKKHIDVLKKVFNTKFGMLLKEAKTEFLEEGGDTIDFQYKNPVQKSYNDALFDYKKRLKKYYNELDKQYDENLLNKNRVIDELKELIDNGEANSMYKNFQEIQRKWREIGPVSRTKYSDLWQTYHFHTERFYDLLHLRNDLRDLDFKHNLDEKLKIIAKAEVLAEKANINDAFEELQNLHRIWKEEIGPVSRSMREIVWQKFSEVTKKIHDKRHEYFDSLKEVYQENYVKKIEVIEKIEAFDTSENSKHKDWQQSIKKINALRETFFDIGKVARNKNKEIWNRFKDATKDFNSKKNTYYKGIKNEQQENLDKKMKLVEQAESLRESEDWDTATDIMKRIQAEWRSIGFVPRKYSDKIWNRFKEACNHYFDRLHNKQEAVDEEKMEVYTKKNSYLENLKEAAKASDFKPDIEELKKYISEWREIGAVPISKRFIDGKFNKFLDSYFDKLSLNKKDSTMLRYRNLMDSLVEQKDFRKLQNEVQFVRKKLDEVTKEKQQLENNMLFFSNADDANPMILNIKKTISKHADELAIWQAKLSHLRTLDV